jgi:malonyl CoA-acyl carrier protein transacylase
MEEAHGQGGYGMVAILGLREGTVQPLISQISRSGKPLYLASVNAPTELVLAGSDAALSEAAERAQRAGARIRRPCVSVPAHCPSLHGVSERLRAAMCHVLIERPHVPTSAITAHALYMMAVRLPMISFSTFRTLSGGMSPWRSYTSLAGESSLRRRPDKP